MIKEQQATNGDLSSAAVDAVVKARMYANWAEQNWRQSGDEPSSALSRAEAAAFISQAFSALAEAEQYLRDVSR